MRTIQLVFIGVWLTLKALGRGLILTLTCRDKPQRVMTINLEGKIVTVYQHDRFLEATGYRTDGDPFPAIAVSPFTEDIYVNGEFLTLPEDLQDYFIHHELGHLVCDIIPANLWGKLVMGLFRSPVAESRADGWATGNLRLHPVEAANLLYRYFYLVTVGILLPADRCFLPEAMLAKADKLYWQPEWKNRLTAQLALLDDSQYMEIYHKRRR